MDDDPRHGGFEAFLEPAAQRFHCLAMRLLLGLPEFQGGQHAHGQGHRFRARPDAELVMPAELDGAMGTSWRRIKPPIPSGPWNLWRGQAHGSRACGAKIDGNFAHGLHGVGVEKNSGLVADLGELSDRLDSPVSWLPQMTLTNRVCSPKSGGRSSGQTRPAGVTLNVSNRQPCSSRCSAGSITF